MPSDQKTLVLRYAQLALLKQMNRPEPDQEIEMEKIRAELKMEHRAIIELAAKNVMDEFEC